MAILFSVFDIHFHLTMCLRVLRDTVAPQLLGIWLEQNANNQLQFKSM